MSVTGANGGYPGGGVYGTGGTRGAGRTGSLQGKLDDKFNNTEVKPRITLYYDIDGKLVKKEDNKDGDDRIFVCFQRADGSWGKPWTSELWPGNKMH